MFSFHEFFSDFVDFFDQHRIHEFFNKTTTNVILSSAFLRSSNAQATADFTKYLFENRNNNDFFSFFSEHWILNRRYEPSKA